MLTTLSKKTITPWLIVPALVCIIVITSGIVIAGEGNDLNQSGIVNSGQDVTPEALTYVPDQLVVKFAPWTEPGQLPNSGFTTTVRQQLTHSGVFLLETQSADDILTLQSSFDTMSSVIYFHPNYIVNRVHPVQGSYPFSDEQHIGDYSNQQSSTMLNLDNSHLTATGAGLKVGVLDGGVDATYSELSGVVLPGWDFVSNDSDPFDEGGGQTSGHGTFVAGVVHLTAPNAQIQSYRVIDTSGYGDGFTLALAIERAVDDGCDVINISLVLMEEHLAVRDAISYAESQGVTVVASAGNEGNATDLYPAAYDNVIAVASMVTFVEINSPDKKILSF